MCGPVLPGLASVEHVIVMGEPTGEMPPGALDYETLLAEASPEIEWPSLDERDACSMAYTSGTTGNPKGVVYSHRSMVMHAYMVNQASALALTPHDSVMPVVPMFHANAWGLPYAATMAGAKLVFPGQYSADPAALASLIEDERVTFTAGVPTVWMVLLAHLEQHELDLSSLRARGRRRLGGPAGADRGVRPPRHRGVAGWGMTETGPLASLSRLIPAHDDLSDDEQVRVRARQGQPVPGIRVRVVDVATGGKVPWDGKAMGEVQVKGNWVAEAYYRPDEAIRPVRRRVAADRRRGGRRRERVPPTRRPHQGPGEVRRRVDLHDRARIRAHGPPGRGGGRRDRGPRRASGANGPWRASC